MLDGNVMNTVTVCPGVRSVIIHENKPNGNDTPVGLLGVCRLGSDDETGEMKEKSPPLEPNATGPAAVDDCPTPETKGATTVAK